MIKSFRDTAVFKAYCHYAYYLESNIHIDDENINLYDCIFRNADMIQSFGVTEEDIEDLCKYLEMQGYEIGRSNDLTIVFSLEHSDSGERDENYIPERLR